MKLTVVVMSTFFLFCCGASSGDFIGYFNATQRTKSYLKKRHSYAPRLVDCPLNYHPTRPAVGISPQERAYLLRKQTLARAALTRVYDGLGIDGLDHRGIFNNTGNVPTVAIAISGGGYRSMLTGAGVLAAFDDRTPNTTELYGLGGLLQGTTYLAGISGGSWLVSSLMLHDFAPVVKLRDKDAWLLNEPLLEGVPNIEVDVSGTNIVNLRGVDLPDSAAKAAPLSPFAGIMNKLLNDQSTANRTDLKQSIFQYYKSLLSEVRPKKRSGFKVTLTDYWGTSLGKKIFPKVSSDYGVTFSDISKFRSYQKGLTPFPILVSDCKNGAANSTSVNSKLVEFNPFEFGSWEPYLNSFMHLEHMGTKLYNGSVVVPNATTNHSLCYSGFDNAGFITGTSSSLFNSVLLYIWQMASASDAETFSAIKDILSIFSLTDDEMLGRSDYALFEPNPFIGLSHNKSATPLVVDKALQLVDGGEDGQNIPFFPFIHKSRQVDVVFAVDSSNDFENWPNGTCLVKSSNRYNAKNVSWDFQTMDIPDPHARLVRKYSTFPLAPTYKEMKAKGYNSKPVFLGCNLTSAYTLRNKSELVSEAQVGVGWLSPLIVYLSNTDHTYPSNTSTFKLTYTHEEASQMITNGYNVATYSNSSIYSRCIGCAMLKRHFDRETIERGLLFEEQLPHIPQVCRDCYSEYCFN